MDASEEIFSSTENYYEVPMYGIFIVLVAIVALRELIGLLYNTVDIFLAHRYLLQQDKFYWATGIFLILATFSNFVTMFISSFFVPGLTICSKYACSGAGFLTLDEPEPFENHTLDFYRCEVQRAVLKSTWNQVIIYCPLFTVVFHMSSTIMENCPQKELITMLKCVFIIMALLYAGFVVRFQQGFESVSDFMSYGRSACYISIFILVLFVINARSANREALSGKVMVLMSFTTIIVSGHVGYSIFHLLCGRGFQLLPSFIMAHGSLVLHYSMFTEDSSTDVMLAMFLSVVPPVCPVVIALMVWLLDTFWNDLLRLEESNSDRRSHPGWSPPDRPNIPRIPGILDRHYDDDDRYRRRNRSNVRRRIQRAHPIRGLS